MTIVQHSLVQTEQVSSSSLESKVGFSNYEVKDKIICVIYVDSRIVATYFVTILPVN